MHILILDCKQENDRQIKPKNLYFEKYSDSTRCNLRQH